MIIRKNCGCESKKYGYVCDHGYWIYSKLALKHFEKHGIKGMQEVSNLDKSIGASKERSPEMADILLHPQKQAEN